MCAGVDISELPELLWLIRTLVLLAIVIRLDPTPGVAIKLQANVGARRVCQGGHAIVVPLASPTCLVCLLLVLK